MTGRRTWLITGTSRGLGRAFVVAALERGNQVVATLRRTEVLDELAQSHPDQLICLEQDVRDPGRADEVVREGVAHFGKIDVLVNNAGFGLVGALEELSPEQIADQLNTNLLGTIRMVKAVLPGMRDGGSGEIVQISTTGAVGTMPFFGLYNASKWALEGYSEALAGELSGFGINVTIAELGGFDTDWSRSSMVFAENDPAYDQARLQLFGQEQLPWDLDAVDPDAGDPAEAAASLIAHLGNSRDERPLRLLVGNDAAEQVAAALVLRRDDYARNPGFAWPS